MCGSLVINRPDDSLLIFFLLPKADASAGRSGRLHELPDRFEQFVDMFVVACHRPLKLGQFGTQSFMSNRQLPQLDERPHDDNIGLYGTLTIQNTRKHGDPLFRKDIWQVTAAALRF